MHVVPVPLGADAYDITIGAGALRLLPETLTRHCPAARYALVADSTVARLHAEAVRAAVLEAGPCDVFPFPAGEWNKSREMWGTIADAMAAAGIGRDGAVIALGGGVTGDLAGFVAATYRRGIPYVQLPTSLLAMIDSSIGGKTGVDTTHGKNLVGAFHQPRAVIADVSLLDTLPDPHLRAGLAEALKHGAIADRTHFDRIVELAPALLGRQPEALAEIIGRSVAIKAEVVTSDPKEHGRRAILNFGHTVAHAVEAASGYAVLHGEAVALGMVVEAWLGTAAGITETGTTEAVEAAVRAFDLPTSAAEMPAHDLIDAMRHDKKVRGGTVKFAFLKQLGQAAQSDRGEWVFPASGELLTAALSR